MAEYSIVIPTFRRADSLADCLQTVVALDYPLDRIEVIIIDNGGAEHTRAAAGPFVGRLRLRYLVNAANRGYGYSVNRGIVESTGRRVMLLNDDARLTPDFLRECDRLLDADSAIGCIGCRAVEQGYVNIGEGVGRVDRSGQIIANFNLDTRDPIEVEHVYGFCYVFTREAIDRVGVNDRILLAQPYSSGDRIETDHCLSIRKSGLKVVYNPRMVAQHLAKPRPDMNERSLRWKRNSIRNTIYLYLKHFGPFGRGAAALRLTFLVDIGLLSMLKHPSRATIAYFTNGAAARFSAYVHYVRYLLDPKASSIERARCLVARLDGTSQS